MKRDPKAAVNHRVMYAIQIRACRFYGITKSGIEKRGKSFSIIITPQALTKPAPTKASERPGGFCCRGYG